MLTMKQIEVGTVVQIGMNSEDPNFDIGIVVKVRKDYDDTKNADIYFLGVGKHFNAPALVKHWSEYRFQRECSLFLEV